MDFIELTKPEYKRMLRRLVWRTPYIRVWTRWYTILGLMICWTLATSLAYYDPEIQAFFADIYSNMGIGHTPGVHLSIIEGALIIIVFILILHLFFLYAIPSRVRLYKNSNRIFVSEVMKLNNAKMEKLLCEYPDKKRIEAYYGKKKKTAMSASIYTTENFLFVPGLFLIYREEIEDIKIIDDCLNFALFKVKTATVFRFLSKGAFVTLTLDYNYDESPETAEQIFAWFWQCDLNDPTLPERTKSLIIKTPYHKTL